MRSFQVHFTRSFRVRTRRRMYWYIQSMWFLAKTPHDRRGLDVILIVFLNSWSRKDLFFKGRWAFEVFPQGTKAHRLTRDVFSLVEVIPSWCDRQIREESFEEYFEESKGRDSAEILEVFKVDEEVLSTKEDSPLEIPKIFSGLIKRVVLNIFWAKSRLFSTFRSNF